MRGGRGGERKEKVGRGRNGKRREDGKRKRKGKMGKESERGLAERKEGKGAGG